MINHKNTQRNCRVSNAKRRKTAILEERATRRERGMWNCTDRADDPRLFAPYRSPSPLPRSLLFLFFFCFFHLFCSSHLLQTRQIMRSMLRITVVDERQRRQLSNQFEKFRLQISERDRESFQGLSRASLVLPRPNSSRTIDRAFNFSRVHRPRVVRSTS